MKLLRIAPAFAAAIFAFSLAASAAGLFPGLTQATPPLTGNECIPADTTLAQGLTPATECVTAGNITGLAWANPLGVHSNIPIGSVAYGSLGTNTTDINGQLWVSSFQMPLDRASLTGMACLAGGTATTDKIIVALYKANLTGDATMATLVANSAVAGTLLATADTFQVLPFTAVTSTVKAGKYYMVVQGNGTTAGAIRTIAASTYLGIAAGSISGTFGTLTSQITFPTTFTANKAPICYVY